MNNVHLPCPCWSSGGFYDSNSLCVATRSDRGSGGNPSGACPPTAAAPSTAAAWMQPLLMREYRSKVSRKKVHHDTCYLMKLQMLNSLHSVATVMNWYLPDILGSVFVYRRHVTQLVAQSTSFPEQCEYFGMLVARGVGVSPLCSTATTYWLAHMLLRSIKPRLHIFQSFTCCLYVF